MPDRRLQLRAWLFAMERLELRLRVIQGRARNAMIRSAAKEYEKHQHPPNHVFVTHQQRTQANLAEHYQRTIPVFADMALAQIKPRPAKHAHLRIERKDTQGIFQVFMQDWVRRESLRKAKMIADTDRDDVLGAISSGLDEGLGVAEIARGIRKVSDLTPYRSAVVARTETHAAATYGSIQSVRQAEDDLGITMMKEWLPTLDDRTRPAHAAMKDYGPIPLDEKFIVGGEEMDRPGDPSGSPENVVNCRCALIYTEAE